MTISNEIQPIDHVQQGVERLSSVFNESNNLKSFISAFLDQINEVENALLDLSKQKDLNTVTGVWLDYIGKIVGQEREGRSDEDYRQELQLKILINKSDGTHPIVSEIVKTYTESDRLRLAEGILSFGQIIFDGELNADRSLWELVQDIKPVTVKTLIVQDTENKSFFPAWEYSISASETLYVDIDPTTSETLKVALTQINLTDLTVSLTGEGALLDPETTEDMFLEWEDPATYNLKLSEDVVEIFNFKTYSDPPFSVDLSEDVDDQLIVSQSYLNEDLLYLEGLVDGDEEVLVPYTPAGVNAAVEGNIVLPWEITSDTFKGSASKVLTEYEFYTGSSLEDMYVKVDENQVDQYYVAGIY